MYLLFVFSGCIQKNCLSMTAISSRTRRKHLHSKEEAKEDSTNIETTKKSFAFNDPFRDFNGPALELYLSKFFYYIRNNFRIFILSFIIIFTTFISAVGYYLWKQERNIQSLSSFQNLMKEPIMNLESGSPKIAIEKLDKYINKNNFYNARIRAEIQKIAYFEKDSNYEKAIDLSLKIAQEIDSNDLQTYFLVRAAIHAENIGLFEKAESAYKKAADKIGEENEFKAFALFGQGRCLYNLNKNTEARNILNKILSFNVNKTREFLAPIAVYLLELSN